MTSLKTLALAAALVGATAVSAQAATKTFSANIPTSSVFPYVYDFTLTGFDTTLGTLTGVELVLTNSATASVVVTNSNLVAESFSNANASVALTVTGPGGIVDTATYSAGPFSGTVAAATYYPANYWALGQPAYTVDGQDSIPGESGSVIHDTFASDLDAFKVGTVQLSYTATSPGGAFSGQSVTGVSFGGAVTTGGTAEVIYTYTAAPEPSTWAMMGLGFAALGFAGMRSTRKSAARAV